MKGRLKELFLKGISRATGRHAVLLPAAARSESTWLRLDAPYRCEGGKVRVRILEPGQGKLDATLFGYRGHFPTQALWRADGIEVDGPCELTVDLAEGRVRLADRALEGIVERAKGRRLSWNLTLTRSDGQRLQRQTGHYLAGDDKKVDASYYQGDNYVDHDAESAGETSKITALLSEHEARGPVLEVGCATGAVLAALDEQGMPAVGIDYAEYAITRATERLGEGRAFHCDAEAQPLPEPVRAAGPFHTLLLWAVFEHFSEPFEVLRKLSEVAAPGALLAINTTNADSLTHRLFADDWEGHFDWTHHGVERVGVASLRRELPKLGWKIETLTTHLAWTGSADPTHASLRDWYAADARFRRLLIERDAGDLITLVARKVLEVTGPHAEPGTVGAGA